MTKTFTIGLDARYDLARAGMDTSDEAVARFRAAYEIAAAEIAAERDIEINVINTCYASAHEADTCDTDYEAVDLWQTIHDRAGTGNGRVG